MRRLFKLVICLLAISLAFASFVSSASASPWWSIRVGQLAWTGPGYYPPAEGARDIAVDSKGYVYMVGMAYTGYLVSPPPPWVGNIWDAFIAKIDPTAYPPTLPSIVWQKEWGTTRDDIANGVAVSPDDKSVYVVGSLSQGGQAFILKFDSLGNLQWSATWGGIYGTIAYDVAVDSSTGYEQVVVVGETWTASGQREAFILKLDSSGNIVWQRLWGTPEGGESALAVALGDKGQGGRDVYVVGYATLPWQDSYFFDPFQPTTTIFDPTWPFQFQSDALILKFDGWGNPVWQKAWGHPTDSMLSEVAHGVAFWNGKVIVVGGLVSANATQGLDAFTITLDTHGGLIWGRIWDKWYDDWAYGVTVIPPPRPPAPASIYVVGESNVNATIIRYNSNSGPQGDSMWTELNFGWDAAYDVAPYTTRHGKGFVYITGHTDVPMFPPAPAYTLYPILAFNYPPYNPWTPLGNMLDAVNLIGIGPTPYVLPLVIEPPNTVASGDAFLLRYP